LLAWSNFYFEICIFFKGGYLWVDEIEFYLQQNKNQKPFNMSTN